MERDLKRAKPEIADAKPLDFLGQMALHWCQLTMSMVKSLIDYLKQIPDFRHSEGCRYP